MTCQEQIRELADDCDGLKPSGQRRPLDALQFTRDSRSGTRQQWICECLVARGARIENLIVTTPDRRRVQPS